LVERWWNEENQMTDQSTRRSGHPGAADAIEPVRKRVTVQPDADAPPHADRGGINPTGTGPAQPRDLDEVQPEEAEGNR
jgi:hypothetical protein